MGTRGSLPTGPSEQFLRLLKGQIDPREYARSVQRRVDAQLRDAKRPADAAGAARA